VGLFNPKDRGDAPEAPQRGAAQRPAAPGTVAKSTRQNQEPPTQGGNHVANIGKSISIKGDLTGNEDMVIEGKVEGKVDLPNNQLTVGANGTVRAEISAKAVVVVGRVAGNVNGSERVEIQGTGVVEGDVSAPRLVVAEGAVLNGAIQMTKKAGTGTGAAEPPAPPPAPEVRKAG
jgi:cytoskeletal protein CcmA (bactofilin family)